MASSSMHNRNPEGKNQYGAVCESKVSSHFITYLSYLHIILVSAHDPVLQEALRKYYRELITDNNRISELLLADYGIDMKYA